MANTEISGINPIGFVYGFLCMVSLALIGIICWSPLYLIGFVFWGVKGLTFVFRVEFTIIGAAAGLFLLISIVSYLNEIKGDCLLYVKIIDVALTPEDKAVDRMNQFFGNICDRYSVEMLLPLFSDINYSGMADKNVIDVGRTRYGQVYRPRQICHFQFYRLIILTDGRVTACCDPLNAIYWGNIHECSLFDMWNGPARYNFLKLQLEKKGLNHYLCRDCYMPNDVYSDSDDLEPYAEKALQRLKKIPSQKLKRQR